MSSLYEKTQKLAAQHSELRPHLVPLLRKHAASNKGRPITLYVTGAAGNLVKEEGYLTRFDTGGVYYIPKRGRKERMVMTYYSPYINVVEGFGHPDPQSLWDESTRVDEGGVVTERGRYRSTDPRWVTDFTSGAGARLKSILLYEGGKLKHNKTGMQPEGPSY